MCLNIFSLRILSTLFISLTCITLHAGFFKPDKIEPFKLRLYFPFAKTTEPIQAQDLSVTVYYAATKPDEPGVKKEKHCQSGKILFGGTCYELSVQKDFNFTAQVTDKPNEFIVSLYKGLVGPGRYRADLIYVNDKKAEQHDQHESELNRFVEDNSGSQVAAIGRIKNLNRSLILKTNDPTIQISGSNTKPYAVSEAQQKEMFLDLISKDASTRPYAFVDSKNEILFSPITAAVPDWRNLLPDCYGQNDEKLKTFLSKKYPGFNITDANLATSETPFRCLQVKMDLFNQKPANSYQIIHLSLKMSNDLVLYWKRHTRGQGEEIYEMITDRNDKPLFYLHRTYKNQQPKNIIYWFSGLENIYPKFSIPPAESDMKQILNDFKSLKTELAPKKSGS